MIVRLYKDLQVICLVPNCLVFFLENRQFFHGTEEEKREKKKEKKEKKK